MAKRENRAIYQKSKDLVFREFSVIFWGKNTVNVQDVAVNLPAIN